MLTSLQFATVFNIILIRMFIRVLEMKDCKARAEKACDRCGEKIVRNERHDSYLCSSCDEWLEKVCRDKECEFCSDRPVSPSEALKNAHIK